MKRKQESELVPAETLSKCVSPEGVPCVDLAALDLLRADPVKEKVLKVDKDLLCGAVQNGFRSLWATREFSDCDLLVGDEKVPSHRAVLSCWSPMLRALLSRWTPDPHNQRPAIRVELGSMGDTPEDFQELLSFLYLGTCKMTSWNVIPLLRLSNYYDVLPLKTHCGDFLFELLSKRDLGMLMGIAEKFTCASMRERLVKYVAYNFEALLESGEVWDLSVDVWEEVLKQDALGVENEYAVLQAVRQYAARESAKEKRTALLQRLLPCVRFPELPLRVLLNEVELDEELAMLKPTKELLFHAYRNILLSQKNEKKSLQASSPQSESTQDGNVHGASSSRVWMTDIEPKMEDFMKLQGKRRDQLPAFDPALCAGFDLSHGRSTASASDEGVPNCALYFDAPNRERADAEGGDHAFPRMNAVPVPRLHGRLDYRDVLRVNPPRPEDQNDQQQQQQADAKMVSVVGIMPHVKGPWWSADVCVDRLENKGKCADIAVWLVRSPRLVRNGSDQLRLCYEGFGVAYWSFGDIADVKGAGMINAVHSRQVLLGLARSARMRGAIGLPPIPNVCEGLKEGDMLRVSVTQLSADQQDGQKSSRQYAPNRLNDQDSLIIEFLKNGKRLGAVVHTFAKDRSIDRGERPWRILVLAKGAGDVVSIRKNPLCQNGRNRRHLLRHLEGFVLAIHAADEHHRYHLHRRWDEDLLDDEFLTERDADSILSLEDDSFDED